MATVHDQQHQHQQLPPSPPPSPPRRRNKPRRADTWEKLATTPLPSPSPPSSPASDQAESQEWFITRIVLTPLYFTSFLISLFIINRSDRLRRASSQSRSVLSYFSPSAWIDPEPYQDPDDSTWDRRDSAAHTEPHSAIAPKQDAQSNEKGGRKKTQSWHLRKKIRKMTKLEVSDAFEMRGRVMVMMVGCLVLLGVSVWLGLRWMVGFLWR